MKYLGQTKSADNTINRELTIRIRKAWRSFFKYKDAVWRSKLREKLKGIQKKM